MGPNFSQTVEDSSPAWQLHRDNETEAEIHLSRPVPYHRHSRTHWTDRPRHGATCLMCAQICRDAQVSGRDSNTQHLLQCLHSVFG